MSKETKPTQKSARPSARPANSGTGKGPRPSGQRRMSQTAIARRKQRRRKALLLRALLLLCVIVVIAGVVALVTRNKNKGNTDTKPQETASALETEDAADDTAEAGSSEGQEETGDTAAEESSGEEDSKVPSDLPDINVDDWEFILANPWNSVEDYTPTVGTIEGIQLDERIIPAMQQFVADCRAAGNTVFLSSGYRDYDTQTFLFNRKVEQYGDEDVAATIVARPGTSEHQTGLAADITDQYYETKNESLEYTAMYQWMFAHCQEYGFILRFPKGRDDVTGIIYEPWHFRYVGVDAATYIMEHELTLEEFLAYYKDIAGPDTSDAAEENTNENTGETG